MAFQLAARKIPFEREFRFHKVRRWRLDFILPYRLAVEVEGIVYKGKGRHQTGVGFQGDLDKYEAAMIDGLDIYRCSPAMIKTGRAINTIELLIDLKRKTGIKSYSGIVEIDDFPGG